MVAKRGNQLMINQWRLGNKCSLVAVILLINAVKLHELRVILDETVGGRIGESLRNGTGQGGVGFLDHLIVSDFWCGGRVNHNYFT